MLRKLLLGRTAKLCVKSRKQESALSYNSYWGYVAAARALDLNGYVDVQSLQELDPVEDPASPLSQENLQLQTAPILSPEASLDKALRIASLSEEAQFVMDLVLDTPAEAWDFLHTPRTNEITKSRVYKYLRRELRWDACEADDAIREVEQYVAEL